MLEWVSAVALTSQPHFYIVSKRAGLSARKHNFGGPAPDMEDVRAKLCRLRSSRRAGIRYYGPIVPACMRHGTRVGIGSYSEVGVRPTHWPSAWEGAPLSAS